MDVRRLRAGELTAATGGTLLFVSLFLPWYGPRRTGWEALAVNDVILALVALAAVAVLLVTALQRVPAVPIAMDSLLTLFGVVGLILVLVRVAWLPDGAHDRAYGLWLGLAGAVAIVAGGWISMRAQRPTHADSPHVELRELPAPGGSE
jgi:hypothetical protein